MQVPDPKKFRPQGGVALPRVPPFLSPVSPSSVPGTPARKELLSACKLMCEVGVFKSRSSCYKPHSLGCVLSCLAFTNKETEARSGTWLPPPPRTQSFLLSLSVGSIWAEGSTESVLLAGRGHGSPRECWGLLACWPLSPVLRVPLHHLLRPSTSPYHPPSAPPSGVPGPRPAEGLKGDRAGDKSLRCLPSIPESHWHCPGCSYTRRSPRGIVRMFWPPSQTTLRMPRPMSTEALSPTSLSGVPS